MPEDDDADDRAEEVRGALLKGLGLVVAVGVLIAVGTTYLVHALDLHQISSSPVGAASPTPPPTTPLPTTALPVPSQSPSDEPTGLVSPDAADGRLELEVAPVIASPMERVNLTGTYQGADNVTLEVQRYDDGTWSNFGVQAQVRVGTFQTYVMTGRSGENRFRMFDPIAKQESNVVLVTIQ